MKYIDILIDFLERLKIKTYFNEYIICDCPSRAREALADIKIAASGTIDLHLHVIFGVSSYYPSSETKMNLRKEIKSRSIARRDEPLL
jgi:hypothetical protein